VTLRCPILFLSFFVPFVPCYLAQTASKRPFTVRDDIEFTQFGDAYSGVRGGIVVSPRGDRVLVHTTHGVLKDDTVRDELRLYDIASIRKFVNSPANSEPLHPVWTIEQSLSSPEISGPVISNIRWLRTEAGFAFLAQAPKGTSRLILAQLKTRTLKALSLPSQNVLSFDIGDERHFVYCVAAPGTAQKVRAIGWSPASVGTGQILNDLLFRTDHSSAVRRAQLWTVQGQARFAVVDRDTKKRVVLFEDGIDSLSLSPDGRFAVTIRPLGDLPEEWEKLYPPPYPGASGRLRAGHQDLEAPFGWYVGDYVRIDLSNGEISSLTDAPAAERTGWWEEGSARPAWSTDGSRILLPGTFVKGERQPVPCVLVVQVHSRDSECVRNLRRNLAEGFESGYDAFSEVSFVPGRNDHVILTGSVHQAEDHPKKLIVRSSTGAWNEEPMDTEAEKSKVDLQIVETYDDPPVLLASDPTTGLRRTVLDPNPQLKTIELSKAELYRWSDASGRSWQGILYIPADFHQGIRYPLVIENHGFSEDRFRPSGGFPSAFAARELASAGIMVLHVRDCPGRSIPNEGMCNVDEYKAAIDALSSVGMVDPARVGLIGFSRTVFYVLEALTSGKLQVAAASITDGITVGYFNYLCDVGPDHLFVSDAEALIGAMPIGEGLRHWLQDSPDFNMDRVTAPLRIVARADSGILEMWEPYAVLERIHKPVDFVVLNTHEHVFSDPDLRLVAQDGNVDWFRFWLQGYEDPDPSKAQQYARWERLRVQQQTDHQKPN